MGCGVGQEREDLLLGLLGMLHQKCSTPHVIENKGNIVTLFDACKSNVSKSRPS
jgi:hypothetical protein